MRRRKRLLVEQVLPDRNPGTRRDLNWSVGYWEGNSGVPSRDFRSFGSKPSREDAVALAISVSKERAEFFFVP